MKDGEDNEEEEVEEEEDLKNLKRNDGMGGECSKTENQEEK